MSVQFKSTKDITNTFHALSRLLKSNGESKLSGSALLDRFAKARRYNGARAFLACLEQSDVAECKASNYISDQCTLGAISSESLKVINQLGVELEKHIIKSIKHDLFDSKKLYPLIIDTLSSIHDGTLTVSDSITEHLWDDFEDGNGYEISDSFNTNVNPFYISALAHEMAELNWHFSTDAIYSFGIEDCAAPNCTKRRVQDFTRDFVRECIRETYPVVFESVIGHLAKCTNYDPEEPELNISDNSIQLFTRNVIQQLFTVTEDGTPAF
ncbi:hypothetical protein VCHA53O466_50011 [Vibrio chagasii]|nr:hypothetical protein VCHA53O466_50011 [Vibrio chagasii]